MVNRRKWKLSPVGSQALDLLAANHCKLDNYLPVYVFLTIMCPNEAIAEIADEFPFLETRLPVVVLSVHSSVKKYKTSRQSKRPVQTGHRNRRYSSCNISVSQTEERHK